jgi:molecular chaperone GrpE
VTDSFDPSGVPGPGAESAGQAGADSAGQPGWAGQRPAASDPGPATPDPGVVDAEELEEDDTLSAEPIVDGEIVLEEASPDPLASMEQERNDYRDALQRLQADFENYKKRMLKQQTDHLERAAASLVEKLLPVLDTADLALAHGGGEEVKQLSATLFGVLEKEGLERIDPVGEPFDPTLHDAVAHEPGDADRQEVAEVLRAGYRWKGRVLRPAMVKVRG